MKSKFSSIWRVTVALVLVLSLGMVFSATPAAADVIYVPDDHATIQEAVTAAGPGDTIVVGPGTYPEDITIGDSLTLLGAQSGDCAIGRTGDESEIVGSIYVSSSASEFTIDGFKVTGTGVGPLAGNCMRIESASATIINNIIVAVEAIGGYTYSGFVDLNGVSNADIRCNDFSGAYEDDRRPSVLRLGIGGASTVTVANNEMHDVGGGGGVGVMCNDASAVIQITDNVIDNTGDGIWTYNSTFDTLLITGNDIVNCHYNGAGAEAGSYIGVNIAPGITSDLEIHNNNIVNNEDYGVYNDSGNPLADATYNWWGSPDGPSHSPGDGDKVSSNVLYCPWLGAPAPMGEPVGPALEVEISAPSGVEVCENFAVTATVTNNGTGTATEVTATISWGGGDPVELVEGESDQKDLGDISPFSTQEANWTLHCTDLGDVEITVTAVDTTCYGPVSDTVIVHQPPIPPTPCTPAIDFEWVPLEDDFDVCVCDDFDVKATVTNTGTCNLTSVNAYAEVKSGDRGKAHFTATGTYYQYINIGPLAGGASQTVTFTLHCDDAPVYGCDVHNYVDLWGQSYGYSSAWATWYYSSSKDLIDKIDQQWLELEITPKTCTNWCVDKEYWVNFSIRNCFDEHWTGDVSIVVTGPAHAEVPSPGDPIKVYRLTLEANDGEPGGPDEWTQTEAWHVKCDGGGDITITVDAVGIAGFETLCDEEIEVIHQKDPAQLSVVVDAPDCAAECEYFTVIATISNPGGADGGTATDVEADISWTGNATLESGADPQTIPDLAPTDTAYAEWEFHCNGCHNATFTVNVTGRDEVCDIDLRASNSDTTKQIDVDVEIVAPDDSETYSTCQTFCVTADITNNDCDDGTVTIDYATITIEDNASLADGELPIKSVGDIPYDETEQVSWTVHCDGSGDAVITVTVHLVSPAICECLEFSDTITVHQEERAALEQEILSPPEYFTYVATSQDFALTAEVWNTGEADALDVAVTLDPGANASVVPQEDTTQIFDIPGNSSQVVTWTVHCDGSGTTTLAVTAVGRDENSNDQVSCEATTVAVMQYAAAHLEVNIITPRDGIQFPTSTVFPVTAIITNTGEADAWEVTATLDVFPAGSAELTEGGYTQSVGTLVGHGQDGSETVTWMLHCKEPSASTFTITAEGNDEYGWHQKQECQSTGTFHITDGWIEKWSWCPIPHSEPPAVTCVGFEAWFDGESSGLIGDFKFEADVAYNFVDRTCCQGHVSAWGHATENHMELTGFMCDLEPCDPSMEQEPMYCFPWGDVGVWVEECGEIQVINGMLMGHWIEHPEGIRDNMWVEVVLTNGLYCSTMASTPGIAILEEFIEPDSVTVKQVLPPGDADLEVTKDVYGGLTYYVGEEVIFIVTVENLGEADATGVVVTDVLPAGLNLVDWDAEQGWYYAGAGIWHVGDLPEGDDADLEIVATVNTVGDIDNLATITAADQPDPNTSNNSDMVTITGVAAEPVTVATIELMEGFNLISLPLIPDVPGIQTMMSGIDFLVVAMYDASVPSWYTYAGGVPTPPFTTMEDGWGYWINMDTAGPPHLTFNGQELVADPLELPPSYDVVEGWNLIGFKSTVPKLPEEYLAGIEGKYVMIYGYDGNFFIAGAPGHEYLQPGLGYWLAIKTGESGTIFP